MTGARLPAAGLRPGRRVADLNDVYDRLGQLTATMAGVVEEQRRATYRGEKLASKLDEVHDEVKTSISSQESLKKKVDDMAPHVEDYKTLKQRAVVLWSIATLVAGFGSAVALDFIKSLWK